MVNYSIKHYKKVQEIVLENGLVKLIIVPEQGGRIVEYSIENVNILFRNEQYKNTIGDINKKRKAENWINFGGYKGWEAPQINWGWPPVFELDLGNYDYELRKGSNEIQVTLTSEISKIDKLQFVRTIIMHDSSNTIKINEKIINHSNNFKNLAVWGNTQVATPGFCEIQLNSDLFFGGITFYQNFKIPSSKAYELKDRGKKVLKIICDNCEKFKVGVVTDNEKLKYYLPLNKDKIVIFTIKFNYQGKVVYPHGSNVEVFVDDILSYAELEVLGKLANVSPKGSISMDMEWDLEMIKNTNER
jgi:hypothetical protein